MDVVIPVQVDADRRLVIDLPPTTPLGPAEVTVRPRPAGTATPLTREAAREALRRAGLLASPIPPPEGAVALSEEAIVRLGTLPPGSRSSEELIAEDRGIW